MFFKLIFSPFRNYILFLPVQMMIKVLTFLINSKFNNYKRQIGFMAVDALWTVNYNVGSAYIFSKVLQ